MKKYLVILLTIAMAACTTDPDTGGGNAGQTGDGGGVNVPDDGTGYYPTAKIFTGFGNVVTNENPIMSWLHPQKNPNNAVKNSIGSRIPSMLILPSGRLVISGDVRWTGNGDLPHKTDTFTRFSDDEGNSWSKVKFLQRYNDFDTDTFALINKSGSGTDKNAGQLKLGLGLADAVIGRASDGTIMAIATLGPHSTGNADGGYGADSARAYKDFNGKEYLMLRLADAVNLADHSVSQSTDQSGGTTRENTELSDTTKFKYGFDANGGQLQEFTFNGQSITKATPVAGYYMDKHYDMWSNAAMTTPINVKQLAVNSDYKYVMSDKDTQANIFYLNSPYWPFRRYTHVTMTRSFDNGETWEKRPTIITHKVRKNGDAELTAKGTMAGMFFVSPTTGYLKRFGVNKGRLLFSAYSSGSGGGENGEQVMVYWTDDGGKTWGMADKYIARGTGLDHFSETAIIEAPDGTLITISRSLGGAKVGAVYAASKDGGKTWTPADFIPNGAGGLDAIQYNQLSAINLSQWKGVQGEALVAFSHASRQANPQGRSNGKITIAALKKDTSVPQGWSFDFTDAFGGEPRSILYTDDPSKHDYSVAIEKLDGNIIVFYEGQNVFSSGAAGMALDMNTIELKGQ